MAKSAELNHTELNHNDFVFTDIKGRLSKYNAVQSSFNHGFMALGRPIYAVILTLQWLLWGQKIFLLFRPVLDIHSRG